MLFSQNQVFDSIPIIILNFYDKEYYFCLFLKNVLRHFHLVSLELLLANFCLGVFQAMK